MKIIIILFLFTLVYCKYQGNSNNFTCQITYNQSDIGIYRTATFLTLTDTYIIKAISPLSIIASLLIIFFYYKFPGTRQQPGDIILGIAISQIFLIAGFITTLVYNESNPIDSNNTNNIPQSFNVFCNITGYLILLPFCVEFIYNLSFCAFFIIVIKNVFKSWQKGRWIVHVICIITTTVIAIILQLTNQIGISLFGVCGFKLSSFSPFLRSAFIIVYTIALILTSIYFRKRIPDFQANFQRKKRFVAYNFRYIKVIIFNLILQTTCDLLAAISCQNTVILGSMVIRVAVTMSNTFSIITPILIFGVVVTHPSVKKGLHDVLISCFGEGKRTNTLQNFNQIEMEERQQQMVNITKTGYLNYVLSDNKSRLVYSILCAIVVQDRQITGFDSLRKINEWNYTDKIILNLDSKQKTLDQFKQITIPNMQVINVQITSYCPRIFKTLMKCDGFNNISTFLNPADNKIAIEKLSQGSGGKSGQFFFFSHDNQIILKTLSKQQLEVLLGRLQALVNHYQTNPNSLITKVYGLYTILSKDTGQQYHVYVMRNLTGCERKFITKTYDLKGSRLDRKVLKSYPDNIKDQNHKISQTMKDLDFEEIEGKLFIHSEHAQRIKQILTKDSQFLKQNRLIDYSLIVMKMNLNQYLNQKQMLLEQFRTKMVNPYAIIQSTRNNGIAYVIGVIDYLQTWNAKKKSQKLTKVLLFFKFQTSSQVSAQSPNSYSRRFIQKVVQKYI